MTVVPADRMHVELYDGDGLTRIGWLKYARAVAWHEELSKPGWATFEVPLADPMTVHCEDRRIVKLTWMHRGYPVYQFACFLQGDAVSMVDGRKWLRFEQQPGLLGMLGAGCVLPERGLARRSDATRFFGFMSQDGNWRLDGNWSPPVGYPMSDETGHRKGYPPELKKYDPDWIAAINPAAHVSPQTKNYYRQTLTLTEGKYATLLVAADNFLSVFHQGEQIFSPDYSNALGWRSAQGIPLHLGAGDHLFGFEVENAPLAGGGPLGNPMGLVYALLELDNKGKVIGTLFKSQAGSSSCIVHDNTPPPGWHRAQVLRANVLENQAYGVDAIQRLSLGFTDFHDSRGDTWPTTERDEYEFDVATVNLADVAAQLTESHLDVWVDPATMTLKAWRRRGIDRSAEVTLTLGSGDDGNLLGFESMRRPARFTHVISQTANGYWLATSDSSAEASAGRIIAGLTLGSAGNEASAATLANKQLDEFSTPKVFVTNARISTMLSGAIPGQDFHVGDTIMTAGWRLGAPIKQRCLAMDIAADDSSGKVSATPGFAQDDSV